MWNKREEAPPPRSFEIPKPEPVRMAAPPRENPAPPVNNTAPREAAHVSPAVIGSSMTIHGEIFSREDLLVDGEVEGKLELQSRLTVGPNGKVRAATIKAREVVVLGTVQGNVEVADKITIRKGGSVVGDIKTAGIVIDDGSYFKGSIDIVKAPPIVTAAATGKQKEAEPAGARA